MGRIQNGKLLYHLTALNNLESIIQNGLMSRDALTEKKENFIDVANQEIVKSREYYNLSSYIPFHFHIHTAFYTIVKNQNPNIDFIYLCLQRKKAKELNFQIIPEHPLSSSIFTVSLLSYENGIDAINWDIMELTQTEAKERNIDLDDHRKIRMAECLTKSILNITEFNIIGVSNNKVKIKTENLLKKYNINSPPYVNTYKMWF